MAKLYLQCQICEQQTVASSTYDDQWAIATKNHGDGEAPRLKIKLGDLNYGAVKVRVKSRWSQIDLWAAKCRGEAELSLEKTEVRPL